MLVDDVVDHEEKKEGGTDVKELEMFFCCMLRRGVGFYFNNIGANIDIVRICEDEHRRAFITD